MNSFPREMEIMKESIQQGNGSQYLLFAKPNACPTKEDQLEYFAWGKVAEKAPEIIQGVSSIVSSVGGWFGGGNKEDTSSVGFDQFMQQRSREILAAQQAEAQRIQAEESKKKTVIWIVVGVVLIATLIGGAFLFVQKRKI